eukprot:scaffold12160_cov60-Phaeocystis_antarctica.AAC.13
MSRGRTMPWHSSTGPHGGTTSSRLGDPPAASASPPNCLVSLERTNSERQKQQRCCRQQGISRIAMPR